MEFIGYDKINEASTVKISDEELVDINSIIWYLSTTFSNQDETLLFGVDKVRLNDLSSKIHMILDHIGSSKN